jgi:BirA family biotin operon repressor/biotin-[acetyl-CoA-carboxylase] ligase
MAVSSANVRRFDEVGSTNDVARELALAGAEHGLVVVADHQTAGRGRFDRRWEAPPGTSLLMSVVLRRAPARPSPLATVAMALAAGDACGQPAVKWPNDMVAGEPARKLGGILAEAVDAEAFVVGLGLNLNWGSSGVPMPAGAVSLDSLVGHPVDRDAILDSILDHLARRLAQPTLVDDYRARCITLGQRVVVETGGERVAGVAVDITADGHLVVDIGGGRRRTFAAADVTHAGAA